MGNRLKQNGSGELMKTYQILISVDMPFPRTFTYREKSVAMHTAVMRALLTFKKEVGRKRVGRVKIEVDKI